MFLIRKKTKQSKQKTARMMKQVLFLIAITLLISCKEKRNTYLISGNVTNIPDSTIIDLFMDYGDTGNKISSDTIFNGQFEFSDSLETGPVRMCLRMSDWENFCGACDVWVDKEIIEVQGNGKYLSTWKATSKVKEQIALNKFGSATGNLQAKIDSLYLTGFKNRSDKELRGQIMHKIDSIGNQINELEFSIIKENPNSTSAIRKLYELVAFDGPIAKEQIKEIYDSMDPAYKNSLYAEGILSNLEEKKIPEIGDNMLNFIAHDTNGVEHSLTDFKGKYILLDFWSLGCGPCFAAMPETKRIDSLNREQLVIIGVSMSSDEESWEKISKMKNISWINLSDGKGTFAGASAIYGIEGFPSYFLINPEGVIVDKWFGYQEGWLADKLKKHMKDVNV
ncbi:hypothetical protein BZG02_12905 [Labilibaculum filiforme]|uniref:Thioredoxin domain-containing protein n=2 Tax=Labilibaculum filiforme TaxID=1940526 RepID=A0A2N3HVY9_9BACT|nr:hypothetical protein BZG02_12905 [Labilibaculum filiforme]